MINPHLIAVDAKGYVWRAYAEGVFWSMAPTNSDNSPIPEPITYNAPVGTGACADLHRLLATSAPITTEGDPR